MSKKKDDRIAIVLLNMGGPDSLKSVKPYLYNLFSDRDMIKFPVPFLQPLFAFLISNLRGKKSESFYTVIGGKSPILDITEKQAKLLHRWLNARKVKNKVYIAMRYWHPLTEKTIMEIVSDGAKKIIALPMYPHFSYSTTGSSFNELKRAVEKLNCGIPVTFIDSYYNDPVYIEALSERIKEGLENFPEESRKKTAIIFSAHSLPLSAIEAGDPYLKQIEATVAAVMEKFEGMRYSLSFQSKAPFGKWLEPDTIDTIKNTASERITDILIVPVSFTSDNVETLYEVDIFLKDIAYKAGVENYFKAPLLNDSRIFAEALGNLVLKEIE